MVLKGGIGIEFCWWYGISLRANKQTKFIQIIHIMKTLFTLIAAVLVSLNSFAGPSLKKLEQITGIEHQDQVVNLIIREAVGKVSVSIFDEAGKLVEKTSLRANEPVLIPFNLSQIPEGEYSLSVSTKDDQVTYFVTNKKPIEKKLLAYAKVKNPNTISLTVVGIEKAGTKVTFYDANTLEKINSDYVEVLAGFTRDYKLSGWSVNQVYLEVKNAEGRSKVFYF